MRPPGAFRRNETSSKDKLASSVYGRHCVSGRKPDHQITLGCEEVFTAHDESADALTDKALEGHPDLVGSTGLQNRNGNAERIRRIQDDAHFSRGLGNVGRV